MRVLRNIKFFFALVVLLLFVLNPLLPATAQEVLPLFIKEKKVPRVPRPLYVPDEIIVKFKPEVTGDLIEKFFKEQGVLEKYESKPAKFKVLKIPKEKNVPQLAEIFKKSPLVEYAEPNYYAYATMLPNDPYYSLQWHFDNPTYGGIQMEQAWDISTGTPSAIVAVVDTGVAYEDHSAPAHWHIDTYQAYSGHSWWCGRFNPDWPQSPGYGNGWKDYLQHSFDLTGATGTVTLSFQYRYDMESNYDYAYIEISSNGGLNWDNPLKTYTGQSKVAGKIAWVADSIDLTSYKGSNILLRFRFNSDEIVSDEDGHLYRPKFDSDGALFVDEIKIEDDSGTLFHDDVESGAGTWETTKYEQAPDLAGTSFVAGYDFINNDAHPNDDDGHGTHVAGTVAQTTNNDLGVAGIAFDTSIMPVKVLNAAGTGTFDNVADGIYFAADNGAKIINLSLSSPSSSTTLENALAYAYGQGVTVIAAGGNEYQEGNLPQYPAAYDVYVIAVGATRYDEARSYYSNTGSYIDLVAPGGDVTVDQNGDGYADGVLQQTFGDTPVDWGYWFYQGTSMSTPHVSGVAALILALKPGFSPDEVREALQSTAEDKGAGGRDDEYGWGIVDAYEALSSLAPAVVSISVIENSTFDYDTLALSPSSTEPTKKSTLDLGTTPVIKNTGDVSVDLAVKSSDATDGPTPWNLVVAGEIGQDKYCHQYSTDSGTNWADFPTNNDYTGVIASGLGANDAIPLDLQILMPTVSNDPSQKNIVVTIRATQPGQ